jgi:hypothetical protein
MGPKSLDVSTRLLNGPDTCTNPMSLIGSFPEVLLAPAGRDIKVYARGNDLAQPILVPKNHFAAKVWKKDAHIARQVRFVQFTLNGY